MKKAKKQGSRYYDKAVMAKAIADVANGQSVLEVAKARRIHPSSLYAHTKHVRPKRKARRMAQSSTNGAPHGSLANIPTGRLASELVRRMGPLKGERLLTVLLGA